MKFSKKDFEESYIKNKDGVDELFNPDGEFGGDKPHRPHLDITTDTPDAFDDTSDREEDIPQTTDDFGTKTKNKSNWQGMYNAGSPYGASGVVSEDEIKETLRDKVRRMAEELMGDRTNDNGLVNKVNYSDVNRNNIPDIEEVSDMVIVAKTKEFINSLGNDLSGDELGIIINHIITNVNTNEIPNDYKRLIKNKIR